MANKYTCAMDLSNVKKRGKIYDWKNSIGEVVPFNLDNGGLIGEFKIIDYRVPEGLTAMHLYVEYNGEVLQPIMTQQFKKGKISTMLGDRYVNWKYNIGDHIIGKDKHLVILDRKKIRTSGGIHKYYKLKCLICGFDGGEHYFKGSRKDSYWIQESDIDRLKSCSCCTNTILVPGINDALSQYPDLSIYFCDIDEVKKLPPYSRKKVRVRCPDCGIEDFVPVCNIISAHKYHCICSDKNSYPNKLSYYLFKQVLNEGQIEYHECEYSPDWAGNYRYDNYIVKDNVSYIIEMDGGLGHGNLTYSGEKDIKGKSRDMIKDKLAIEHNIRVIRIDCIQTDIKYIKNSLLSSELASIINLNNIDWDLLNRCATKNIHKEICLDYKNNEISVGELANKYSFSRYTIREILKKGNKYEWCNYGVEMQKTKDGWINKTAKDMRIKNKERILNYCKTHDFYTGKSISRELSINHSITIKLLKELTREGLIEYNPKYNMYYKSQLKPVGVFDLDKHLLRTYYCAKDCVDNSINDFGVLFDKKRIYWACQNFGRKYKGYLFKYM